MAAVTASELIDVLPPQTTSLDTATITPTVIPAGSSQPPELFVQSTAIANATTHCDTTLVNASDTAISSTTHVIQFASTAIAAGVGVGSSTTGQSALYFDQTLPGRSASAAGSFAAAAIHTRSLGAGFDNSLNLYWSTNGSKNAIMETMYMYGHGTGGNDCGVAWTFGVPADGESSSYPGLTSLMFGIDSAQGVIANIGITIPGLASGKTLSIQAAQGSDQTLRLNGPSGIGYLFDSLYNPPYSQSGTTSGYAQFGPIMIQWGQYVEASGIPSTVTFPRTFSQGPWSVTCTQIGTTSPNSICITAGSVGPTGFTVWSGNYVGYWMAIGRY